MFQELFFKLLFTAGKENFRTLVNQLPGKVPEEMDMCRMAYINQYSHYE